MSGSFSCRPLFAFATLMFSGVAIAEEAQDLKHNPFSRPPSAVSPSQRLTLRSDGTAQTLDLRATMVASNDSLANVAGKIVHPGEEIQGYTLLQVFEDHAVFTKQGSRLTIFVNPNLDDDSE